MGFFFFFFFFGGGGGGVPEMYALDVRVRDPKIAAEFGERMPESEA